MGTVNRNTLQINSFWKKRSIKQLLKGSLTFIIVLASGYLFMSAQKKPSIYKKGWIDFNKNGVMDVYENPEAAIDDRVADLLSQMTLDEKTCQLAALYGLNHDRATMFPAQCGQGATWNRNNQFVVEPGTFTVMVGNSSQNIKLTDQFTVKN